jgi:hypothetical protein
VTDLKPGQRYRHGWIPVTPGITGSGKVLGADTPEQKYALWGEHVGQADAEFRAAEHPYIPIKKSDLSTPDARRSRAVSEPEFQKIAARGAAQYQQMKRKGSATVFEKDAAKASEIANRAYTESREPWGGSTIDAHTGEFLPQGADKYALTVREPGDESVTISTTASAAQFRKAFSAATTKFGPVLSRQNHYLGVFHDADKNEIEFDPVLVTPNKEHTETIGAYTHAVGGAYHFKSGNGFWPPHIEEKP